MAGTAAFDRARVTLLPRMLAVAALCRLIDRELAGPLQHIVVTVLSVAPRVDLTRVDLVSALLAADLLLETGNPRHATPAAEYCRLLRELVEQDVPADSRALIVAALMPCRQPRAQSLALDIPHHPNDGEALTCTVASNIESASHYGLQPVRGNDALAMKTEAMSLLAQRRHDLPLALRLLRARAYLVPESVRWHHDGAGYVRQLQTTAGAFGDFDTGMLAIRNRSRREQARLEVQLTVTAQSLWTLFELETGNRLMRHFQSSLATAACTGDAEAAAC